MVDRCAETGAGGGQDSSAKQENRARRWQRKGGNFTRTYSRRSVVKVSYRRAGATSRKGKSGGRVKHANYLSRERAQIENGPGLGFDAKRGDIDIPDIVQEWKRPGTI
jgi:hypothetical protein